MRKVTLENIAKILRGENVEDQAAVLAEVEAELAKGAEKAEANRAAYAEMETKVMDVLRGATTALTAQDIADETGITRGKIVYGLTKLWKDKVEVVAGKTNSYIAK